MSLLRQPDNAEHQAECLSLELCLTSPGVAPDWVQLIPVAAGQLVAHDGRTWTVKDLASVITATNARYPGGICVDINHATDLAAPNGQDAPAAGWIRQLAAKGPNGEDGLWGKVDWTPRGKQAVADGEYRYVSPVLFSRKSDKANTVALVARCSLVNDPALMTKALFHNTTTENDDVKISAALLVALGLAADASEDKAIETAKGLCSSASRLALLTAAGGVADGTAITDDLVTGLCAKLKAPANGDAAKAGQLQAQVDDLQKELASLKTDRAKESAAVKVEAAIKDGKITPAQKDWAIGYCSREPAEFDAFIAKQPKLLSDGSVAPTQVVEGELNAEQKAICAAIPGLTEEAYKAELAAQKKGK